MKTVWIYINTAKEIGDEDHLTRPHWLRCSIADLVALGQTVLAKASHLLEWWIGHSRILVGAE